MLALSATPGPQGLATWPQILSWFGISSIGLIGIHQFRRSCGKSRAYLAGHREWTTLLIQVGFALVPMEIGIVCGIAAELCLRAFIDTNVDALGILAVLLGALMVLGVAAGAKELLRPSKWRRRHQRVRDFEQGTDS